MSVWFPKHLLFLMRAGSYCACSAFHSLFHTFRFIRGMRRVFPKTNFTQSGEESNDGGSELTNQYSSVNVRIFSPYFKNLGKLRVADEIH